MWIKHLFRVLLHLAPKNYFRNFNSWQNPENEWQSFDVGGIKVFRFVEAVFISHRSFITTILYVWINASDLSCRYANIDDAIFYSESLHTLPLSEWIRQCLYSEKMCLYWKCRFHCVLHFGCLLVYAQYTYIHLQPKERVVHTYKHTPAHNARIIYVRKTLDAGNAYTRTNSKPNDNGKIYASPCIRSDSICYSETLVTLCSIVLVFIPQRYNWSRTTKWQ